MTLYDLSVGMVLDLPASFSVSLKKSNIMFAFDDIQCERSLSFDLPVTPRNDLALSDARNINGNGVGARVRHEVQLQGSGVVIDGDLYVTEYTAKDNAYKAVLVGGEMLGLKRLKDAGNLAEYVQTDASLTLSESGALTPDVAKLRLFSQVDYATTREVVMPSIRLHGLIELAMQRLGVPVTLPFTTQYVRIILDKLQGARDTDVTFTSQARGMSTSEFPVCYLVTLSALNDVVSKTSARISRIHGDVTYQGRFEQFIALQDLQLEFPSTWADDMYVGRFLDGATNLLTEFEFLGGRSFDIAGAAIGASLRGRSVEIPRGTAFTFISKDCYINRSTSAGMETGWYPVGAINVTFGMSGGDIQVGSIVRLRDNLPEHDVVTLLKIVSALSGLQLNYSDDRGVSFVTAERTDTLSVDGRVMEESALVRMFGDYAQRNIVRFKSEDGMPERDKLATVYNVDNASLAAEKLLFEIPYSEGYANGMYGGKSLILTDAAALADADTLADKMVRVTLRRNQVLTDLCDYSTRLNVRVRMTLLEYQRLHASMYVVYHYAVWAWTEATWSDGVATLTLARAE